METLLVDAGVAVKWVVEEEGTAAAVALRSKFRFAAPELFVAECANILWKKVQRRELSRDEALLAARLLERSGVELLPMRGLMEQAATLAIDLGHPAYDCAYLVMARRRGLRFVTADRRLVRMIADSRRRELASLCVALDAIAADR